MKLHLYILCCLLYSPHLQGQSLDTSVRYTYGRKGWHMINVREDIAIRERYIAGKPRTKPGFFIVDTFSRRDDSIYQSSSYKSIIVFHNNGTCEWLRRTPYRQISTTIRRATSKEIALYYKRKAANPKNIQSRIFKQD